MSTEMEQELIDKMSLLLVENVLDRGIKVTDELEELRTRIKFLEQTYIPALQHKMLRLCKKWGKEDPALYFANIDETIDTILGKFEDGRSKADKVKNVIAFLFIMFGEDDNLYREIMAKHPDYLVEKFERYIESQDTEHEWGLHPSIRRACFDEYCRTWRVALNILDKEIDDA